MGTSQRPPRILHLCDLPAALHFDRGLFFIYLFVCLVVDWLVCLFTFSSFEGVSHYIALAWMRGAKLPIFSSIDE